MDNRWGSFRQKDPRQIKFRAKCSGGYQIPEWCTSNTQQEKSEDSWIDWTHQKKISGWPADE